MNSISPWLIFLSCACIWPLIWVGVALWFVNRKIRIRSPFYSNNTTPQTKSEDRINSFVERAGQRRTS